MRLTNSHRMNKTFKPLINGRNFGENFHVSSIEADGFNIGPSCIQEWTLKIFIDLFRERQHF